MLLAIVRDLLQLFRPYAVALHPETTQVWFSVRDTPVSWLYPAGAVKDYVNECIREERAAQLSGLLMSSPSSPSAASLLQSHLCSILSEPLQLIFHIHSLTKGSSLARTVPFYINYDRLEEHIRMEVKQAHKAAYTVLYGNYAIYQREAESALQAAVGLALYRPFDAVAQEQLQQQRYRDLGFRGNSAAGIGSSSYASSGNPSGGHLPPIAFTSPYLLTEYQQLLRGLLTPQPHVAYLIRIGFPFAYRGAAGRAEGEYLQYDSHRVSAAPALALSATVTGAAAAPAIEPDQLPLGLLLWRLFRIPVLRWKAQQPQEHSTDSTVAAAAAPTSAVALSEVEHTYQHLLRTLAPYYADPPRCATDRLEKQEPLLTSTPLEPPAWAAWEHTMVQAFMRDYEEHPGKGDVGLAFVEAAAKSDSPNAGRRVRFMVQGLQPPLSTPGSFLEANLSSSDRAIFVTVQV
ncbi:autophagy protein 5 (ATG5) [Leishmania panamensis]|uniref:Autophagy protein 5 (ATG5) n=1 Tax=Leishmania panamensis TaxID=5679 RepID=A0A088RWL7_LEIPA|nr:autophagy protein 5 (ATG5) [Leishmania panamensis]AIO00336.1 autophagy protein 5 (ATG5) [Leishmania panamensis]